MTQKQKVEIQKDILKKLNWQGAVMIFPYRLGHTKSGKAIIRGADLLKIIKYKDD